MSFTFKTTDELKLSKTLADQVIGQEEAVDIIRKAAKQRRNCMLIGVPGTGKSMLGQALAELLPKTRLVDILAYPNCENEDNPLIKTVPAGMGFKLVRQAKYSIGHGEKHKDLFYLLIGILVIMIPFALRSQLGDIMAAAFLIAGMLFIMALAVSRGIASRSRAMGTEPKILVNSKKFKSAPFVEATGAHAGALLGDVRHDPLQSGGLGTPAHLRIVPGMIHKANGGVLFIDEIATLSPKTQQELLTAMQEKKYAITGQSEHSSGAMTRTEPVPCDFILVAAGNEETVQQMHPALRSRIRGYGYEIYMNDMIKDTSENQNKIAQFVAQEVGKDGKIPHFTRDAVLEVVQEARRRASQKGCLTLVLRDLGGLVRSAGDLALEDNSTYVLPKQVVAARRLARPLEQQIADKYIDKKREYEVIRTSGEVVGRVNGLAVIGSRTALSGIVLPIESVVTPGGEKAEIIATGKLGDIAKEAIKNVAAIIMKNFGEDIKEKYDIYTQFLQTYEGVEGDSASIAVAAVIISALNKIPVRQDTALTGSLSIRGEVLPVGGITAKVEAAIAAGLKRVIIPQSNKEDLILSEDAKKQIEVIHVKTIRDVLKEALVWKGKEKILEKFA